MIAKKILILILLAATMPLTAGAQSVARHQVRAGWGDMLFETLAFHPGRSTTGNRTSDFGYTGHIFGEYSYRFTDVVSVGFQVDFQGIFWMETPCDINRDPIGPSTQSRNYDLCLLPNVQFTYMRKEWVELYSGVGLGLMLAFDNAHNLEAAPALNLNLFGARFGHGNWWGAVELGGLSALRNANAIYMFGSRIISVSVGYRW